ncbi:unnamed protein product [Caenorhabditis bovis]|uniref:Serpentine receptor class gamma n=1 Tax=Caenorhabditis bovis TaxID=2654633 RepID=A0A8S1E6W3_9PELO|nr:unnamed protein product [Caenorhabditis bovis]
MLIILIYRNWKELGGSFFQIYIVDFFVNLLTFLNSFVTLRIPQNTCKECLFAPVFDRYPESMEDVSIVLNVCHTLHVHMAYVQYLMTFLTALNRFTMIYSFHSSVISSCDYICHVSIEVQALFK